jgi:hypothetical protein
VIDSAVQKLNMPNFYDLHVTSVCEGKYTPENKRLAHDKNVESCMRMSSGYNHVIDHIPQLGNLDWPSGGTGMDFASLIRATVALYCVLVCVIAFALFFEILGLVSTAQQVSSCSRVFNILATVLAFVVSTFTTIAIREIVASVVKHGGENLVQASAGTRFLALNWISFISLLLGSILWCLATFGEFGILGKCCS